jgi:hypothetical protein
MTLYVVQQYIEAFEAFEELEMKCFSKFEYNL